MSSRVVRGVGARPSGFFDSSRPAPRPQSLFRAHNVELDYAYGSELTTLVERDDDVVVLRLAYGTLFSWFSSVTAKAEQRVELRSSAAGINGPFSIEHLDREATGSHLLRLRRAAGLTSVAVDLAVEFAFGDRRVGCSFNSMSAVGGTLAGVDPSVLAERGVVRFDLDGSTFRFPTELVAAGSGPIEVSFQPLTSEPLERLAGILHVAPPPVGHLSMSYISGRVSVERTHNATRSTPQGNHGERRRGHWSEGTAVDDERSRLAVVWADLPSHRVVQLPA